MLLIDSCNGTYSSINIDRSRNGCSRFSSSAISIGSYWYQYRNDNHTSGKKAFNESLDMLLANSFLLLLLLLDFLMFFLHLEVGDLARSNDLY